MELDIDMWLSCDRSLIMDPLSCLSFQPVFHNWYNIGCGMCYPVCQILHIKEPLLLIRKSKSCSGGRRFPLSLSGWSFIICPTLYNHKKCVECIVKQNQFIHFYLPKSPLNYFSFRPVLHDSSNKGCVMCYPVSGMMHIKEPLLLIGKSSPCIGSGFPLLISD